MKNDSATVTPLNQSEDSKSILEHSVKKEFKLNNDKISSFSSQPNLFPEEKGDLFAITEQILTSSSFGEGEFFREPKLSFSEINRINREISKKIPNKTKDLLKQEHIYLVKRKFNEGISKKEERRLVYIRWQLDRIDDADYGEGIDRFEFFAENLEKFSSDVGKLINEIRLSKKSIRPYKR
jgi:hypothetical protein